MHAQPNAKKQEWYISQQAANPQQAPAPQQQQMVAPPAPVVEVPPAVELPAAPVEKEALAKTIFGKDFEVRV